LTWTWDLNAVIFDRRAYEQAKEASPAQFVDTFVAARAQKRFLSVWENFVGRPQTWLNLATIAATVAYVAAIVIKHNRSEETNQIVNASYDSAHELYQTINPMFVAAYEEKSGRHLIIVQSHDRSSTQARKVVSGEQPADVVTLGFFLDIDSLRKGGLVGPNWANRLPNQSVPYTSTIVFVVRRGNPYQIKDWPDLLASGLEITVPDPRTSDNGKLAALAAWAATTTRGGADADAVTFLRSLFRHVRTFDEGALGATNRFANPEGGHVQLMSENEAIREVAGSNGELEIVYPPISILAEPSVAWIDSDKTRKASLTDGQAYVAFLFSEVGQETVARQGYRPYMAETARRVGAVFPPIKLIPVSAIARDWNSIYEKFFVENGIIEGAFALRNK
jgi:sulfate/thiosulfate-binding protein